jgi:hypothetical protein
VKSKECSKNAKFVLAKKKIKKENVGNAIVDKPGDSEVLIF